MNKKKTLFEIALHECFKEMYAKSQPSGDYEKIIKEFKDGIRSKDERVYEQYYLSQEEYEYIVNKYIAYYHLTEKWKKYVSIVEDYLNNGGTKTKYISEKTDENGNYTPGYKGYEHVAPLKEQIENIIYEEYGDTGEDLKNISEKITNKVMELIDDCKSYYRFDKDEDSFRISCALGASPSPNPKTVNKYWKQKTGKDIQFEERIPELFWYYDEGYTDEDLADEFEDLGKDWKNKLYQKWKDEKKRKEEELNNKFNEIKKLMDNGKQ